MMRYSERSKNNWKKEEVWTDEVALWPGHQAGAVIFKHVRRNPRISSLLI